jgi:transcription elongation factor GreA
MFIVKHLKNKLFIKYLYKVLLKNIIKNMKNYTTKSGLQMMQEELHHLSTVEYKNAIEMLQEARDKGDLSENAEYEAAKEYHANVMNKISALKEKVRNSEVINVSQLSTDSVNMLSTVEIKNHKLNVNQTWRLVSESEIDTKNGKISFNSPIGMALIGHKVGEIVEVNVPSGTMKLEILSIK